MQVRTGKFRYNRGMLKTRKVITFTLATLLSFPLWAQSTTPTLDFDDAIFPELATSARALAMGNAYVGKVDDSASAFYNPAGLGTVRHAHLHLSNFHLETNKDWMTLGAGGKALNVFSKFTKGFSVDGLRQLLKDNPGNATYNDFHFTPNFTMRFLSFGYLISKKTRAKYDGTTASPNFEYANRLDHGPYGALNLSLFGGVFKVGTAVFLLNRNEEIKAQDINTAVTEDPNKGVMLMVNAGARLTLPMTWLPTVAATLHNAGEQSFSKTGGPEAPDTIKQNLVLGFSLTPQIGKALRLHLEVNYKDAMDSYGVDTARRIQAGMELDIARKFFLRAGMADGWGSGGIGLRTPKLEVDLTTYARDLDPTGYRKNEDRRFVLSFSSGF